MRVYPIAYFDVREPSELGALVPLRWSVHEEGSLPGSYGQPAEVVHADTC